ncbi:hypothetical protein HU200_016591 [Digitaria exilis]|uniref:Phytochrome n=1 Tax=Digitaria exilis TaxID=1010633 RepID=A0A835F7T8_9POAL|nr:hypothetical protein HU200_016591 [Digitaria exilis]
MENFMPYLQHIQRGSMIQPFGFLLAFDAKSLKVIAFSENAPEMLSAVSHAASGVDDDSPNLCIGSTVASLFADPGATMLSMVLGHADASSLNPILIESKSSDKLFYAIVHHATGCLVVDFEPENSSEFPTAVAWASLSYKFAAKAISKIQSLPGGSMDVLCNTLVQEVFDLTGYDRVMAYKFHEDNHGSVIAEITKPALRAPHSCHVQYMKNMKSVASLVMAVVLNEDGEDLEVVMEQAAHQNQRKKLWGLIICHHGSSRYVPFPVRHACELVAQLFAVHISKELELEKHMQEKSILGMQARLSSMLFWEQCPLSIISGSPNIMDLVKCDGAALLYGDKVWQLHTTPTVSQIRDIAIWLSDVQRDSSFVSFDSIQDAAYPGLASLGDKICGLAMGKISSSIILFWFRSRTTSEIKWGGAKHDPCDKDDDRRMNPRLSFKEFLEVVQMKSLAWNSYEMDAMNSLQLVAATTETVLLMETATVPIMSVDGNGLVIGWNQKAEQVTGLKVDEALGRHMLTLVEESSLPNVKRVLSSALRGIEDKEVRLEVKSHGSKKGDGPVIMVVNACINRDFYEDVAGVCFVAQDMNVRMLHSEGNTEALINYNPNLLTPMFGADKSGRCNEWNAAMTRLTGWHREEILHKMLLGEVFGCSNASCVLKGKDAFIRIFILISSILVSDKIKNEVPFGFFERNGRYIECLLSATRKENGNGVLTGVSCFLHFPSHELQRALHVRQVSEETAIQSLIMLHRCIHRSTYLGLGMDEFVLQDMMVSVISKVQTACKEKGVIVSCSLPEKFLNQRRYGDCFRVQKILSDFLFASVKLCPIGGSIAISPDWTKESIGENIDVTDLELRYSSYAIRTGVTLFSLPP